MKPLIALLIAAACLATSLLKAQQVPTSFDKDIVGQMGNYEPLIGRLQLGQTPDPTKFYGLFTDNHGVRHPAAIILYSGVTTLGIDSNLGTFIFTIDGTGLAGDWSATTIRVVPKSLRDAGKLLLDVKDHSPVQLQWAISLSQFQGTPLLKEFAGIVSGTLSVDTNAQANITGGNLTLPIGSHGDFVACPIYGGFVSEDAISTVVKVNGRNFVLNGTSAHNDYNFDSQLAVYGNKKSSVYLLWSGSCLSSSPNSGLAAYWKMDEASGTRQDSSGNGHQLTEVNTVNSASGIIGNCAQFSGSNYLQTNSFGVPVNSDFTVSAWVNLPRDQSAGGASFLGNYDGNGLQFANNIQGSYTMQTYFFPGSAALGFSVPANFGSWQHLVLVRSGNFLYGYSNGVSLGAAVSVAGKTFPGGSSLYVGAHVSSWTNQGEWFIAGGLDEIGVWSRALSASEVTRLYNSGQGHRP